MSRLDENKYYVECRRCGEVYNVWTKPDQTRPKNCRTCRSAHIDAKLIEVGGERILEEDER